MAQFIEYKLEDGTSVLILAEEGPQTGRVNAGSAAADTVAQATQRFEDALASVKATAARLRHTFEDLASDEVEVKFAIKTAGELGFAIGKVGVEANFEITLKWSNTPADGR
jgi:hypothetical protein